MAESAGLKPVGRHRADVLSLGPLVPAGEVSTVDASAALGLRVASDLRAPGDLPAFASASLDGYAVRVADVPGQLDVVGLVPAGAVPDAVVSPGRAVRIMTGGMLPVGTEAVVGVEVTDARLAVPDGSVGVSAGGNPVTAGGFPVSDGSFAVPDVGVERVNVRVGATAGAAMRAAGSDVRAGAVVVRAGQRIGPAQVAALIATGHLRVPVWRRPRVLVVSTGDELVEAGTAPGPAQLVDSNRPALLAAAAAAGAEVIDGGLAGDDPSALLTRLTTADADLVITSGGISMGAFDVVKLALRPLGVHFDRVAMQPGMPQAWGRLPRPDGPAGHPEASVAFVGLPGNPVSALVSFAIFVRPLLGRPARQHRRRLAEPIEGSPAHKTQYLRARLDAAGSVVAVGGAGSHQLVSLAGADLLIVVPDGVSSLPAGAQVLTVELEETWS